jgi:hypothetical protein
MKWWINAALFTGSRELYVLEPMQRMIDRLNSRGYPCLELLTHVFEDEGHSSAYAASINQAFCMLYDED